MPADIARPSRPALLLTTALCAASCAELAPDEEGTDGAAIATMNGLQMNGLQMNGLQMNGLQMNGLQMNGLQMNGLQMNGLSTPNGLSSWSGLMTTIGGRQIVEYMVKCAYPAGRSLVKQDQYGASHTFLGSIGVAPEAEFGACDLDCQEKISACMLAHVNNSGLHVSIWVVGPDAGIGWGTSPDFPFMEATYFGNLVTAPWQGDYCAGKNLAAGDAAGRMGSPLGDGSSVFTSPYGWQTGPNGMLPVGCGSYCTVSGPSSEGYASCVDPSPRAPYTAGHAWRHPVTVYRNFEATQLYKICNKATGKCLGVVGGSLAEGAKVEQRTYTGAAGQTWQILQTAPGTYKIVNKTSGKSLDLSGSQVVQKTYSGAASQRVPIAYSVVEPGKATLKMASNPANVFHPQGLSTADGTLVQVGTAYSTSDAAKWTFTAIGLAM